jgi:hypothetical protein
MKKTILILSILLTCLAARSQNSIQYKVLTDDPMHACNLAVGIDIAQLDFGFKNIDGWAFSTGVWGFLDYQHKFGADFIFRYGYLTFGKAFRDKENLKAHRQIEIGGYLPLRKKLVSKTNKVVLKVDKSTTTTHEVTTTTFVMVPSKQFKIFGVRAGFMDYGGALTMDEAASDADINLPEVVNYNVLGLYAGIFTEKYKNVLISTDKYAKKGVALHTRFYIDALITPVSSVKYKDIDYKEKFNHGPVGARMGIAWYPMLTRKEARPDYPNRFLFQTEAGIRPYDGIYVTGTISIAISKHIAKFSDGSSKPAGSSTETE